MVLLDTESNVTVLGKVEPGTFSDGKAYYTDKWTEGGRTVLEEFIKGRRNRRRYFIRAKPHVGNGTCSNLQLKNIRQEIIAYGGEVRFKAKVN